jgi:hypothetical protein
MVATVPGGTAATDDTLSEVGRRVPATRHGRARRRERMAADVQVVVAATTLAGVDDDPGYLGGYGAINADLARRLAHEQGATWRRILTDPRERTVLEFGRRRYRPPRPLAEHVRARDPGCVHPGCTARSLRCQLDHIVPWRADGDRVGEGGTTCRCNLAPLCIRHHRLKTKHGWTYLRDEDGAYVWQAGTGHRYRSHDEDRGFPRSPERDCVHGLSDDAGFRVAPDAHHRLDASDASQQDASQQDASQQDASQQDASQQDASQHADGPDGSDACQQMNARHRPRSDPPF